MNFTQMKMLEPELGRLERSARFAGEHQAAWSDVFVAIYETLSKLVGRGSLDDQLQDATSFEVARAALFAAWLCGSKGEPVDIDTADVEPVRWPWEAGWGDGAEDFQHEMVGQYG